MTRRPAHAVVPELLLDRRRSIRWLAAAVGVSPSHMSRALGARTGKSVSGELAARIASVLNLPQDYFPETRLLAIRSAASKDGALRDELYETVAAAERPDRRPNRQPTSRGSLI